MNTNPLLLVALATALSACGAPPEIDEAADDSSPAASPAAYVMGPGKYAIGSEETGYATTEVNADGTYIDRDADGAPVGRGTWRDDRGMACFDPSGDGPEEQERCWTNSELKEDGSFVSTLEDGSASYTIRPLGD